MSHIVCQATDDPQSDELELLWSEGAGFFEPYRLRRTLLQDFNEAVEDVREELFKVVVLSKNGEAKLLPEACLALATAGYRLYEALFPPKGSQNQDPEEVRTWLEGLRDDPVESLEVLLAEKTAPGARSALRAVPWNVLYDKKPDPDLFRATGEDRTLWSPFWGVRYNLAVGRKVDPRRRMSFNKKLHVIFAVDPEVLPADEWGKLQVFAEEQGYPILRSYEELERYPDKHPPVDLLYCLCHADPNALELGGSKISPVKLYRACKDLFQRQSQGLVMLNACQTADPSREGSFMQALHDAGLSGMVATVERTVNIFANRFGLAFLKAFLIDGEAIGPALQKLRAEGHSLEPLGLLYGTYCPPHICAQRSAGRPPSSPVLLPLGPAPAPPTAPFVGAFLGPQVEKAPPPPLPEHPYRSLAYYEREHRALFAGRDADVQRFALMLDEAHCRIAVLHGQSGVGKSSFLRAGLIPFLEEESIGYQFLRNRQEGQDEPILFIRATSDPTGPLAKALCDFCARGDTYAKPIAGRPPVNVDLPGILGGFVQGAPTPAALREALRADTSLLGRLLAALADRLWYTLVLVIDQGEEVFTLARTREDEDNRRLALEMLRRLLDAPGRFKVIVSLRTEYYGRLLDALRQDVRSAAAIRDYFLFDLQDEDLTEAILLPTATTPIRHASEVPAEKYRFRYEPGVAETIARDIRDYCRGSQDSELPLAQIICTQLYELVRQRPDAVIGRQEIELTGGVQGGLRKHVGDMVNDLLPHERDRTAFKRLFGRLSRRQSDRLVTTELIPEDELAREWRGRTSFAQVLELTTRSDRNLLRVKTLTGEQGERRYVSLGHDALAKVAVDWDEEYRRGARVRRKVLKLGAFIGVGCLAISALFAVWAMNEIRVRNVATEDRDKAEEARKEAVAARDRAKKALEDAEAAHKEADQNRERAEAAEKKANAALFSIYSNRISDAYRYCNEYNFAEAENLLELCKAETPELCRWEWNYLKQRCRTAVQLRKKVKEIKSGVSNVAFSPDGGRLAARWSTGVVQVWEVAHLDKEPVVLPASDNRVGMPVFSRDGSRLATRASNGVVRVWEAAYLDKEPLVLRGSDSKGGSLVFSPDGSRLAASGDIVRVWEVTGPAKEPLLLSGSKSGVGMPIFSPDGSYLAARWSDGAVRVWEVARLDKEPLPFYGSKGRSGSLEFSPHGSLLLIPGDNGVVWVWEVAHLDKEPLELPESKGRVGNLMFNRDGSRVAARSGDGTVRVWEVAHLDKKPLLLPRSENRIGNSVFSRNGSRLAASGRDGVVRVWEVAQPDKKPLELPESKGRVGNLVFSRDGGRLAASGEYGVVRIWEVAYPPKEPLLLSTGKSRVTSVQFTPDGGRLAGGGDDGLVRVWEVARPATEPLEIQTARNLTVSDVAFGLDGPRIATAGSDGMIRVWKAVTSLKAGVEPLQEIFSWKRSSKGNNLAISRDGQYVATGDYQGIVTIWDVASPDKAPRTFKGSRGNIADVAFSPCDNHFAVVDASYKTIKVFDITRPEEEVYSLTEAKDTKEVVFSPDGQYVATVAQDGTVRIWDGRKSDKVARTYKVHMAKGITRSMGLAFSPDGYRLAVANPDGVMLCDAMSGNEILTLQEPHKSQQYYGIAFGPKGNLLAATTAHGVMFWGATPLPPEK